MDGFKQLRTVFTKNRAEELEQDIWEHFVVPPFFDRLDLQTARKPRLIIGGRGCGKTMLLRYLAHQTTFSPKRRSIPINSIEHIGLYWRVDTQSARIMNARGKESDTWISAFHHLIALVVGIQILESLESIAQSACELLDEDTMQSMNFSSLSSYMPGLSGNVKSVKMKLEQSLAEFETWIANIRKVDEPHFLPGTPFLNAIITEIKRKLPKLNKALFFVYLDEFENLLEYQQRIINTYLKHSQIPLIFNVAMKRNGFVTRQTIGDESISDISDFRIHNLEEYILSNHFNLFAAEVLFLNLANAGYSQTPVQPEILRDPTKTQDRQSPSYQKKILDNVRAIFPGLSHSEVAARILEVPALRRKLETLLKRGLDARGSKISVEKFIRDRQPEASVVASALVHRPRLKPEVIVQELDKLEEDKPNKFLGDTDWIHNNLVGCILAIYESYYEPCPIYAGFDTFCSLSKGNLRHFLELCHRSALRSVDSPSGEADAFSVSITDQANASREAAVSFLREIRSFGMLGPQLHSFVLALGSLLAISQQRPAQSEPERGHFAVTRGGALPDHLIALIREAVKWSVLFEEEETKIKDPSEQPSNFEYVPNPIYAPYFNITYRKGRKLELMVRELDILCSGNYEKIRTLLKGYSQRWNVNLEDANPTLFSHLSDE